MSTPPIVKEVSHRVSKNSMKFGIQVPSRFDKDLAFDKANGKNLWAKAIEKERKNVQIAFSILQPNEKPSPGSKLIACHFIFDVKFDKTQKARLLARGHRNKTVSSHITYSLVASRESVIIGFLIASLNGMNVLSADIENTYLNAINKERVHVILGPDIFGGMSIPSLNFP